MKCKNTLNCSKKDLHDKRNVDTDSNVKQTFTLTIPSMCVQQNSPKTEGVCFMV